MSNLHSWASSSRYMPPSSAFRHLSPVREHSGTGPPYFGTGLVPASTFLLITVPVWLDAGHSDIPAFKKGIHPARPYCWLRECLVVYTLHVHRQLLMVLFLLFEIEQSYVNVGMSEYRRKVSPASTFLPVVSCISPASAFRHQGSVRYRWSRISPALLSNANLALAMFTKMMLMLSLSLVERWNGLRDMGSIEKTICFFYFPLTISSLVVYFVSIYAIIIYSLQMKSRWEYWEYI